MYPEEMTVFVASLFHDIKGWMYLISSFASGCSSLLSYLASEPNKWTIGPLFSEHPGCWDSWTTEGKKSPKGNAEGEEHSLSCQTVLGGEVLYFDLFQGISCEAGLVTYVWITQEDNNFVMIIFTHFEWSTLRLILQKV